MPVLSDRVGTFTDSVIRRMTRINNQYDSINLSQGFPDFDPPKQLLDALAETAYKGPHQYAVTFGAQNFREVLAKKTSPALHHEVDPNTEICVTCGGTEAMMAAMMTICNPGDKVMIFSPFYENYGADAILSGAEPIYIPLVPPTYEFDISLIEKGFAEGAKALILCNPSNPCGKVFRRDELEAIAKLAIQYDAFVVTDEVYEHIIYAPAEHICMASLPGMFEHTITCNSLSKTYSITGWRLGYLIGPAEVIEGARKVHDFLHCGCGCTLAGGCCGRFGDARQLLRKAAGPLHRKARSFFGRTGPCGAEAQCSAGHLFCDDRYFRFSGAAPVQGLDRPAVL